MKYEYVLRHCWTCCLLCSLLLNPGHRFDSRSSSYQGSVFTCSPSHVYHCIIRFSSQFLKDVSGTDCVGYCWTWRIFYTVEREQCFLPLIYDDTSRCVVNYPSFISLLNRSSRPTSHHIQKGTVWLRSVRLTSWLVVMGATEHVGGGALNVVVVWVSCGSWTLSQSL